MNLNLKIGIAGYGVVGKKRKKILDNIPGVEVVAISDINTENKVNNKNIKFFKNYKDLFNEDEWKKFNKPSFRYAECSTCSKKLGLETYKNTNGFFTEYSMTIPSEDMAEVFSHLITGNYEISDDKILNKKIKFIKDKLKEIDNTFTF